MDAKTKKKVAGNVDEYIADFPPVVQPILQQIRATIKKAVPGVEERISYGIPGFFKDDKMVIYFGGFKKHVGMYPVSSAEKKFKKEFSAYKTSGQGTIQFPLDQPLPVGLITKIVKFRLEENKKSAGVMVKKKKTVK